MAEHLIDVLRVRAEKDADAVAYDLLDPSGAVAALTYAQVASRASALAAELARCGEGPVLLAYPAGLDYVVGVYAAFLAGRPVIPAYPPGPFSVPDGARFGGIIADARPSAALAPEPYPDLTVPTVLTVPGEEADGTPWSRPAGAADQDVAIVQYTSGSTGTPRGVLVRHDSVAANTAVIAERFRLTSESRALTWLPPFHDMGLVGGLLTPMAAGIPTGIIPPEEFLKSPLWWLRQMSETRATTSGGPNFAFDLCVRRVRRDDDLAGLDLSCWEVAYNGGESVKHATLAAFADTFAAAGFRREAFMPSYGLAEATLMVSTGRWTGPAADPSAPVSCGTPVPDQDLAVVDPERLVAVEDGAEGEIWVAGPHVTPGYLNGDSSALFGELGGLRYLRTGDLGRLVRGELYVTGRTKDVIVFRGANFHAVDVEAAALDEAGPAAGASAAFLVDVEPEPFAALVVEVRGEPDASLAGTLRAAVLGRTRLPLGLVVLVPRGAVPRTSSGKVRRFACREALLAGWYDACPSSDPARVAALAGRRERAAAASDLAEVVCGVVAAVCEAAECRPDDDLLDVGVDSLRAAEAAAVLEDALGMTVPLETMLVGPTPRAVAEALVASWADGGRGAGEMRERLAMAGGEGAR